MDLRPLLAEMQELAADMHDPERTHGRADDLLCEAVTFLAGDDGRALVDAYRDVRKWYA